MFKKFLKMILGAVVTILVIEGIARLVAAWVGENDDEPQDN